MPCLLKISLKDLCRCFCWNQIPGDIYDAYFPTDGYRFQFRDWNNWLDAACVIATPVGASPTQSYQFSFPYYLPLYAYAYTDGTATCDCPSEYDNQVFFGASSTCATDMYNALSSSGRLLPGASYSPVPSAYMIVSGVVSFSDVAGVATVNVSIGGTIVFPGLYTDIGLPFSGCVFGIPYNGSKRCILFDGSVAVPGGWTDGVGGILSPLSITNTAPDTYASGADCSHTSQGEEIPAHDGTVVIDAADSACDTSHSDACPTYTANCCQNGADYSPCEGNGSIFTPDAWTVTTSGISFPNCTPYSVGSSWAHMINSLATEWNPNFSFCISWHASDGWQNLNGIGASGINALIVYSDSGCTTQVGSFSGAYGYNARLWRYGSTWRFEIWSEADPSSFGSKPVFFRGELGGDCDDPLVFTNSISAVTTDPVTDVNTDAGWNVSTAAFWASGGTATLAKCC